MLLVALMGRESIAHLWKNDITKHGHFLITQKHNSCFILSAKPWMPMDSGFHYQAVDNYSKHFRVILRSLSQLGCRILQILVFQHMSATVCLYRPQCICTFQFDDVAQLPSTVSNEYGTVFTFPLHFQMGSLVFFFLLQYCKPHNVRANHNMQMGDQRGNCSNLFFCSFLFSLSDKPLSTLSLFFSLFFLCLCLCLSLPLVEEAIFNHSGLW